MKLFLSNILGEGRSETETVGVGGVDAAEEWLYEAFVGFVAQSASGKGADALVT